MGANTSTEDTLLKGAAAASPTDVWAVGYRFLAQSNHNVALIEHFDGNKWSIAARIQGSILNAVQAISPTDIFAAGASSADNSSFSDALVIHFDGTKWSGVPTPHIPKGKGIVVNQLAIVSATDMQAVGSSGGLRPTAPFAMHFDGTDWREVAVPTNGTPKFASPWECRQSHPTTHGP